MIKKLTYIFVILILTWSCSSDSDETIQNKKITINFIHEWDGTPVTKDDFNDIKFKNENGDSLSIEKYRYVISDIKLVDPSGFETPLKDYLFIDLGEEQNLSYSLEDLILDRTYSLRFTFGFTDDDNQDGVYLDLNSANFNVSEGLGGGYHYMQFDGKYKTETTTTPSGFNYHAIRAVDNTDPANLVFQDTSFTVSLTDIWLNSTNEIINVKVNIAEWFKNPNIWKLDELNQGLMPNFDAQILMNGNGKSVFSL
ncbi:MbnP family protein [Tenacibaculum sp. MEBiC06402]|uniref:MbnP family protein n=1 Tax=unclassified Tenacibaculum TaxID=2635139 RepID=UPI003B9A7249